MSLFPIKAVMPLVRSMAGCSYVLSKDIKIVYEINVIFGYRKNKLYWQLSNVSIMFNI